MRAIGFCQALSVALVAMIHLEALPAANCSVTTVSLASVIYTNTALPPETGSVDYICTRDGAKDGDVTFNIIASAGNNYAASSRNGVNGTRLIPYSLSSPSGAWGDNSAGLGSPYVRSAFLSAKGSTTSESGNFPFSLEIAGSLNPFSGLAYTDTVVIGGTCTTSKNTACTVTANTLSVNINVPVSCSISTPPGNLTLAYVSFQSIPGTANSSFAALCSNGGPYRMSITPAAGAVLGVSYGLKLGTSPGSATDLSSTSAYNLTGTGSPATYYVNASAAPGQSGTCATGTCASSSAPHTLTVEY